MGIGVGVNVAVAVGARVGADIDGLSLDEPAPYGVAPQTSPGWPRPRLRRRGAPQRVRVVPHDSSPRGAHGREAASDLPATLACARAPAAPATRSRPARGSRRTAMLLRYLVRRIHSIPSSPTLPAYSPNDCGMRRPAWSSMVSSSGMPTPPNGAPAASIPGSRRRQRRRAIVAMVLILGRLRVQRRLTGVVAIVIAGHLAAGHAGGPVARARHASRIILRIILRLTGRRSPHPRAILSGMSIKWLTRLACHVAGSRGCVGYGWSLQQPVIVGHGRGNAVEQPREGGGGRERRTARGVGQVECRARAFLPASCARRAARPLDRGSRGSARAGYRTRAAVAGPRRKGCRWWRYCPACPAEEGRRRLVWGRKGVVWRRGWQAKDIVALGSLRIPMA